MAYINLNVKKLRHNFDKLNEIFLLNSINWSIVTKMLCGHEEYLSVLLDFGIKQVCDSRIYNLKIIKKLNPDIETLFIKPAAKSNIPSIVEYADISFNTELSTLESLSKEAVKQNKIHKVVIMIELGELREGVLRDDLLEFYSNAIELPNLQIIGLGANLSCLYGVLPNHDKLIQLSLYKELIEAKFQTQIEIVSGGSSVTIPLLLQNILPNGVNHFRIGETLFLGTDVYNSSYFDFLESDVLTLHAQIIELTEKPVVPMGEMNKNVEGMSFVFDDNLHGQTSYRAIIDVGLLDVGDSHITPIDDEINIVGASSDMIVVDIGENIKNYKVNDFLVFRIDYMGAVRLINSKYIDKYLLK